MRSLPAHLARALLLASTLAACDAGGDRLHLRGRVPTASSLRLPGAAVSALSASDATQVIVLTGNQYDVRPIVDGSFDVQVPTDRPVGLVLVGPMGEYLGFVAVRDTIPGVPVQAVDEGVTVVDLGTLVDSGTVLQPGIDPIGNGITLDESELAALAALGAMTRAVLANPDADGDGVVDLLQRRGYAPQTGLFRSGTLSGLMGGIPGPVQSWQLGWHILEEGVTAYPTSVTTTGPAGSGIDTLVSQGFVAAYGNVLYPVMLPSPELPPPAGTWTVSYGMRTLSLQVPDLAPLALGAPTLQPTVTLNADQTIQKIDWIWRLADGSVATTPSNLAVAIKVQVNAGPTAPSCDASNLTRLDASNVYAMRVPVTELQHRLACQNIPWSTVTSLQISFTDVYDTDHAVGYAVP